MKRLWILLLLVVLSGCAYTRLTVCAHTVVEGVTYEARVDVE